MTNNILQCVQYATPDQDNPEGSVNAISSSALSPTSAKPTAVLVYTNYPSVWNARISFFLDAGYQIHKSDFLRILKKNISL